ncbi:hypothetical protein DB345_05825 [Spartobacteria bacterium LR76]|nr:hypothetical protein DB345_05825 [Spartobacteria bacterium LR76]
MVWKVLVISGFRFWCGLGKGRFSARSQLFSKKIQKAIDQKRGRDILTIPLDKRLRGKNKSQSRKVH